MGPNDAILLNDTSHMVVQPVATQNDNPNNVFTMATTTTAALQGENYPPTFDPYIPQHVPPISQ